VIFGNGPYDVAKDADALLILTEWDQFRALDLERIKSLMRTPVVVDLRNVYKPAEMARYGFTYVGIGRG
jgi:UDPglucose 6-dehydrogenase